MVAKPTRRDRKYTIKASMEKLELPKITAKRSGIYMEVKGGEKLGELGLGHGSVRWWTKNARTNAKPTVTLNWDEFARLMDAISDRSLRRQVLKCDLSVS